MSWDAGFSKIRKYEGIDLEQFLLIKQYLEWKNNAWNFESPDRYPTFEKYWGNYLGKPCPGKPNEDLVKLIEENEKHEADYGGIAYDTDINWWGTWDSQRILDGFITDHLTRFDNDGNYYVGIDRTFIEEGMKWVDEQLEDCKLIPVAVIHAYKENKNGDIKLVPCDGLEIKNLETDEIRRIRTNFDEDEIETIYVPSKNFDDDRRYYLESFKETLFKLSQLDLDNELVWYWRSY